MVGGMIHGSKTRIKLCRSGIVSDATIPNFYVLQHHYGSMVVCQTNLVVGLKDKI